MANMRLASATRNELAQRFQVLLDAGAGNGTIKIYTGTQPASADDGIGGATLLGTLTFSKPSAPAASGGVLTFNAIAQDDAADASGTATWARIADSDGNTVFDCDVGMSGATINLNTTTIVAGGPISITSFTITVPAG
jgi:hypothetical protein